MIQSQKNSVLFAVIALLAIYFIPMDSRKFPIMDITGTLSILGFITLGTIFLFGWRSKKNWVQVLKGIAIFGVFFHILPWFANFNLGWTNQYISIGSIVGIGAAFLAYRLRGACPEKYHRIANIALYVAIGVFYFGRMLPDTATGNLLYATISGAVAGLAFLSLTVTFSRDDKMSAVHTFANILLLVFMASNTISPITV